jgi:hypothetical protein
MRVFLILNEPEAPIEGEKIMQYKKDVPTTCNEHYDLISVLYHALEGPGNARPTTRMQRKPVMKPWRSSSVRRRKRNAHGQSKPRRSSGTAWAC